MKVWNWMLKTDENAGSLPLRLTLALVMFPHGAQKVLGWFGGNGFSGTYQHFTQNMHLPGFLVLLILAAEFLAPLALVAGLLTRLSAFGIGAVMVGAIATVHAKHGFFMNWSGKQPGEGFEYHLLVIGMVLALLVLGGGRWSLDGVLTRKSSTEKGTV